MLVLPSTVTSEDELRLAQAVERLAARNEANAARFRALSDARNDRTEPKAGEYVPRPSSGRVRAKVYSGRVRAKVYWWQKGGAA